MLTAPQKSGIADARYIKVGDDFRAPCDIWHPVCSLQNPIQPRTWRVVAFGGGRCRQFAYVMRLDTRQVQTIPLRCLIDLLF